MSDIASSLMGCLGGAVCYWELKVLVGKPDF